MIKKAQKIEKLEVSDNAAGAAVSKTKTTKPKPKKANGDRSAARKSTPSIANALDIFLSRARDIELAVKTFIPLSHEQKKRQYDESLATLNHASEALTRGNKGDQAKATSVVLDVIRKLARLQNSDLPGVIQTSLFIGLFSQFDAFTGELFRAIYSKNPNLFNNLNKTVELSSILQFKSFDELKDSVLEEFIEDFRRKSYVVQIGQLESTFGFNTLKSFPNWPKFVESTQRRNLHTHNAGKVTKQYIKLCEDEGFKFPERPSLGSYLKLDPDYLIDSCEILMEVAFKLTHTIWRKLFPEEFGVANHELIENIYDGCLLLSEWKRAITFSEFAISQKNLGDGEQKILIVNLAIGLKFSGDDVAAKKLLTEQDWSGSAAEFRLAKAVLLDEFDRAGKLMCEIGPNSNIISESSYYDFPLFREFRKSPEFTSNYLKVFGHKFTSELKKRVTKGRTEVVEGAKKEADIIRSTKRSSQAE